MSVVSKDLHPPPNRAVLTKRGRYEIMTWCRFFQIPGRAPLTIVLPSTGFFDYSGGGIYKNLYNCLVSMKPLRFVGSSLDDLRNFPDEARRAAGFELRAVQNGLDPSDWRPMQAIGSGAREIRIHVLGEWRVIYVAKPHDTVYVFHSFKKTTRKTGRQDIELARQRYKQIGG
jgi:phage-related protein